MITESMINEYTAATTSLTALTAVLERIAIAVEQIASATLAAPSYRHSLADFRQFDWPGIGAHAIDRDDYGVTAVQWNGHLWTRRSNDGKFGLAIWFSRPDGKDENGDAQYLRLITFKDLAQAEPIPTAVARRLPQRTPTPPPPATTQSQRPVTNDTPTAVVVPVTNGNGGDLPDYRAMLAKASTMKDFAYYAYMVLVRTGNLYNDTKQVEAMTANFADIMANFQCGKDNLRMLAALEAYRNVRQRSMDDGAILLDAHKAGRAAALRAWQKEVS